MSPLPTLARNARTTAPSRITPAWNSTGAKRWYSDAPRPTSLAQFDIELDSGASEQLNGPDAELEVSNERTDGKTSKTRSRGPAALGRKVSPKVIEMELKWLKDPRALADRVARLLAGNDVGLATGLVRAAQKERMDCAVGWNHLFEYYMKKGDAKTAFKLYNDVCFPSFPLSLRWLCGADRPFFGDVADEETRPETERTHVYDYAQWS